MLQSAVTRPSFSPRRKWSIGLSVLISALSLIGLLAIANYLSVRYFERFHWTNNQSYVLSPLTKQVLASLTNEVRMTVFFARGEDLYPPVMALINEYRRASPKLVVREVDLIRDPTASEMLKRNYPYGADKNVIVFESNGRTKAVLERELSQYDSADISHLIAGQSQEIRRTGFQGEQMFTSAILTVSDPRQLTAYFLQGHGEHDPTDEEGKGYSKFALLLRRNNIAVQKVTLSGEAEVPPDCQLMVIAGQKFPLDRREREKIEKYLNEGGRLLAFLSTLGKDGELATTGLESLLGRWGVDVGDNQVTDLPNTVNQYGFITTNFGSHPVIRPMQGSQLYLYLPRSVEKLRTARQAADSPKVEELFFTSRHGQASKDVHDYRPIPSLADRRGSIPLAVAVEKGSIQGISARRGSTRMVVVGESYFLNNSAIAYVANSDFAHFCVNWLLDRSQLIAIGPRPMDHVTLTMTQAQMSATRWVLLGAMPGSILLIGLLVGWRRRH